MECVDHERDEYFNYSSKNITYRASIGSKARWWSETSKGFSKGLTDSMAEVKYSSNEGANFDCVINDNNEMITFNQYF